MQSSNSEPAGHSAECEIPEALFACTHGDLPAPTGMAPPRQVPLAAAGGRAGNGERRTVLTAPMSATPEARLMTVGMMLNFPACKTDPGKVSRAGWPVLTPHLHPAQPAAIGVAPLYPAIHQHIKADAVGFNQGAELHPRSVSVVLGKPAGDSAQGSLGCPGPLAHGPP